MSLNFSDHRETIVENLVSFLRLKGYSKLSLSKLTDIDRSTIDQILKCEGLNSKQYNRQIKKINKIFDLPEDYFITSLSSKIPTIMNTYSDHDVGSGKNADVKELLCGLNNILDIYSLYLK
jgi:transcriptional regulator with XRE-family HTH domain